MLDMNKELGRLIESSEDLNYMRGIIENLVEIPSSTKCAITVTYTDEEGIRIAFFGDHLRCRGLLDYLNKRIFILDMEVPPAEEDRTC